MTSREIAEWRAFYNLEPFGDVRADYQAAVVANAVYRAAGGETKLTDFLLRFAEEPQTAEQIEATLNDFFRGLE